MPIPDLTLYVDRYVDESTPNPDGRTVTEWRTIRFRLGTQFGPFVERFKRDTYTEQQFLDRVNAIRRELTTIHQP